MALALWSLVCVRPVAALEGPEFVEPYRLVRITHRPDGWLLIDSMTGTAEVDVAPTSDPTVTVFTGPPGSYLVRELSIAEGRHTVSRIVVTIGTPPGPTPPGPEPPPQPLPDVPVPDVLPDTQYKIGPAVARQWRTVLDASERKAVAAIFREASKGLLERTLPTTQDGVTKVTIELRAFNTNDRLRAGHQVYVKQMLAGFDAGIIRTVPQHAGAFAEISEWLVKD